MENWHRLVTVGMVIAVMLVLVSLQKGPETPVPHNATPTEVPPTVNQTANQTAANQTPNATNANQTASAANRTNATNQTPSENKTIVLYNAEYWKAHRFRGAVVELDYKGADAYPTADSLRQLRSLGANIVNLEVQYLWTMEKPYKRDETQFEILGRALDNIKEANLSAIVSVRCGPGRTDLFSGLEGDPNLSIYYDQEAQDAWLLMLEDMVTTFGNRSEVIAWEPMAEPTPDSYFNDAYFDGRRQDFKMSAPFWNRFADKAISQIRKTGDRRPVVIEPVFWGGPEAMPYLARSSDSNIIYSIHTYEPYDYTHQEGPEFQYDYPGDVGETDYDRDELEKMLKPAFDFKKAHDVPMLVGEYGGMRFVPDMGDYIGDMVYLFEKYNLSHTYYNWGRDPGWDVDAFNLQYGPNGSSHELSLNSETFAPILRSWMNNPPPEVKMTPLNGVGTFAYVIQDPQDSISEMSKSRYDMLVIDDVRSITSNYSMSAAVRKLKSSHSTSGTHKMVLAYMSIGEAEDYRWYWKGWSTSTEWVVAENPLWDGNYIVEYWHPKWKKVISEYLAMIAADGFDGVSLDCVDVYELDKIKNLADKEKKDPKKEMISFVCEIYRQARTKGMMVIAQNALDLGASKEYLSCIDGVVQEAIWYDATGSKEGDNKVDPKETSSYIKKLKAFQLSGLPVFSIDYALEEHNANEAYFFAAQQGYVEYVTMLSLNRLSGVPPKELVEA